MRTAPQAEQTIFLVNTPQCLMAEGLADLGGAAAVGPGWGPWAAEILDDLGLRMDGELAEGLEAAASGLLGVRQDAALMLHDQGADPAEVLAYLRRWLWWPRTASQADAAVSLRSAVARLHHHLCRGVTGCCAPGSGSPPAGAAISHALPAVTRRAVDPVGGAPSWPGAEFSALSADTGDSPGWTSATNGHAPVPCGGSGTCWTRLATGGPDRGCCRSGG